jgi:TetR/AcrR family acrAB operon transcriptional repressor
MGKTYKTTDTPNPEREVRILDAVGRLILRYGFDKTTVDDIAREAGISKGAVYLHFGSKDDLLEALIWYETKFYMEAYLARVEADPMGGTMGGIIKHALAVMNDQPIIKALYSRDIRIIGNFLYRRVDNMFTQQSLTRKEFIAAMQHLGLVRAEIDTESVAYILNAFTKGFLTLDEASYGMPMPSVERVLETLSGMLDAYLTPPGLTSSEGGKALIRQAVAVFTKMSEERKTGRKSS